MWLRVRVSPVVVRVRRTLDEVLEKAKDSCGGHAQPSRRHQGRAQATASRDLRLRATAKSKEVISEALFIADTFHYDLSRSLDDIRPEYVFDVSCQGTVPQAIQAFLESTDYENAVRLAISLGGDSDTLACITGGIAQAFYGGVPLAQRSRRSCGIC